MAMAVSKVILNGTTLMDVTQKTVTAGAMLSGTTALKNDGTDITGTLVSKSSSDLTVSGATVTAPAGVYSSAASKSVASGTAGTPTATKGTVSNHSVSVTPSVTNTTGYITGGTKTGTAITVTASELESGTKSITANGTGIDVTGYSAVDVAVSGGGSANIQPLSVTANGTYTATGNVDGYSPVTVSVSGGGGREYESGTWTPTEDIANYIIPFVNTHSTPPSIYVVADVTDTATSTTNDNYCVTYVNYGQLTGDFYNLNGSLYNYGLVATRYKSSESGSNGVSLAISTPYTDTADTTNAKSRFWATETGIKAYTNSSSRYWRAGRTIKWFAVW